VIAAAIQHESSDRLNAMGGLAIPQNQAFVGDECHVAELQTWCGRAKLHDDMMRRGPFRSQEACGGSADRKKRAQRTHKSAIKPFSNDF
jgi:hypothetical protein